MQPKKSFLIALIISVIGLSCWELYWRSQGKYPTLNDDKALWAMHRADVETANSDQVVIFGSSRAYFDIQLSEWKKITGQKPIQLSSTGSPPLPSFRDLVNNTNFSGTVIVGVTPGLFFSTTNPTNQFWRRIQSKIDYFEDRTYADRLSYRLSIPLQQNLVFMSADEEIWTDDIDLKSLLRRIQLSKRTEKPQRPPFYFFGEVNTNRNMSMTARTAQDTAFANSIINVWNYYVGNSEPLEKENTMAYFLEDVKKFKERNGNLILLRCPSSGGQRFGEGMGLPRADYWDELVSKANVPAYHFEDYDQLKDLKCPEESHLSKEDAEYFTREIAKIMLEDGTITKSKTN